MASSSNKRHSILPPISHSGPRAPVNFSSTVTISDNAILTGTHSITVQADTVIHPRSRLESSAGSILVGRRCIINERGHLGALPADASGFAGGGVVLGDYVTLEVAVVIEAGGTEIGEGTTVGASSKIGSGATIGKVKPSRRTS
jgi:dynactin 6